MPILDKMDEKHTHENRCLEVSKPPVWVQELIQRFFRMQSTYELR
jgi:hypothetical protein